MTINLLPHLARVVPSGIIREPVVDLSVISNAYYYRILRNLGFSGCSDDSDFSGGFTAPYIVSPLQDLTTAYDRGRPCILAEKFIDLKQILIKKCAGLELYSLSTSQMLLFIDAKWLRLWLSGSGLLKHVLGWLYNMKVMHTLIDIQVASSEIKGALKVLIACGPGGRSTPMFRMPCTSCLPRFLFPPVISYAYPNNTCFGSQKIYTSWSQVRTIALYPVRPG